MTPRCATLCPARGHALSLLCLLPLLCLLLMCLLYLVRMYLLLMCLLWIYLLWLLLRLLCLLRLLLTCLLMCLLCLLCLPRLLLDRRWGLRLRRGERVLCQGGWRSQSHHAWCYYHHSQHW